MARTGATTARREDRYARSHSCADETQELRHLLRARAGDLPSRLHFLYELRYIQGLTERETAAELKTGRSSVRWLDKRLHLSIAGT